MKKGLIVLLVITLVFTLLATFNSKEKETIVIYSSAEEFRNEAMQKQLNAAFPQYRIVVEYLGTGKLAAKIAAEGKKTDVDIVVGLETGYLNNLQDNLADISGISTIPYAEGFTPDKNNNKWVTWECQAGAIVVNTKILQKHGLKEPRTYQDLLNPEYKGLVAMPNPRSSGTGYFFLHNWVNEWGRAEAFSYVDKLYPNIKQFTDSGSGPIKLLKQGEVAIGLGLTFQAVSEINDGQPFKIIFPEEGSPYSLTGTSIIKGHEERSGVAEVFEFIANDFLKYDKENFSPETIYEGQVNNIVNYPVLNKDYVYADMTDIQNGEIKKELQEAWKY